MTALLAPFLVQKSCSSGQAYYEKSPDKKAFEKWEQLLRAFDAAGPATVTPAAPPAVTEATQNELKTEDNDEPRRRSVTD